MKKIIAITGLAALALAGAHASQLVHWDFDTTGNSAMASFKHPSVGGSPNFTVKEDYFVANDTLLLARPGDFTYYEGIFKFSLTANEDIRLDRLDDYSIASDHSVGVTLTWEYRIFDPSTGTLSDWQTLSTIDLQGAGRKDYSDAVYLGFDLLAGQTIMFQLNANFGPSDGTYDPTLGFDKSAGLALYTIPEPSTWLLLGVGAAVVALVRRRKHQQ